MTWRVVPLLGVLLVGALAGCVDEDPAAGSGDAADPLPELPEFLRPYENFAGDLPEASRFTTVEAAWMDLSAVSAGAVGRSAFARLITDGHAFWVQVNNTEGGPGASDSMRLDVFTRVVNPRTGETVAAGRLQTDNGTVAPRLLLQDAPYQLRDALRWEVVGYLPGSDVPLGLGAPSVRPLDGRWLPLGGLMLDEMGEPSGTLAKHQQAQREALLRYWAGAEPAFSAKVVVDRDPRGFLSIEGPAVGRDTFDVLEDGRLLGPWETGNYTVTVEARNFFVGVLYVDFSSWPIVAVHPNTTRFEGSTSTVQLDGFLPLRDLAGRAPGVAETERGTVRLSYEVDFEVREEPSSEEPVELFARLDLGYKWNDRVFARYGTFATLPVTVEFEPRV